MRRLKENIPLTMFILLMGLILGSFIGDLLGMALPDGAVKTVMTTPLKIGFHPISLDLHIFTIVLGFMIKINLFGFIGVLILGYSLKWLY
ncbi:DUF4321 domain-containing protein [candidate division WOR-3 bacterium]|nr:DUF4321 domain-containing protein [candidate division WOR-3 bacterium]